MNEDFSANESGFSPLCKIDSTQLLDEMDDGVFARANDGTILYCNSAFVELTGYSRNAVKQCWDCDKIHSEDYAGIKRFLESVYSREKNNHRITYRLFHARRHWVWIECTVFSLIEIEGQTVAIFIARDITAEKQREIHLMRMRNIMLESQKMAHFGSFEYIASTRETVWSDEEFHIYGLDPADGSPDYETMLANSIHPDDARLLDQTFKEAFANQTVYELEHRIVRPDGSVRIVHDLAHPYFDDDGNLYKYIGTTHDITERKELEARFFQSQKMESIGLLAGGIAHDFNNILIPILGYVELAIERISPSEKLYAQLNCVKEAAERATRLTRQILAFSRRQILETETLNLNHIVSEFRGLANRLIGEDIEIQTYLSDDLNEINADKGQIEQILLNLCINARDAMPDGGKLTIETSNIYIDDSHFDKIGDLKIPGSFVMLAVTDSGSGMDESTKAQIFEPFFTTKGKGKGTGLGLSTVFGIVKQHQGGIWVYSEPGHGTTFKIYIPRSSEVRKPKELASDKAFYDKGSETIMVVEDEDMVRDLISETLQARGYEIIAVKNPMECMDIVSGTNPIDLLLTDVVMPQMNGRELYREVNAMRPELKVLYMSGYTDNVIVHHGILDDGVQFLQKPFTIRSLSEKVRMALEPFNP